MPCALLRHITYVLYVMLREVAASDLICAICQSGPATPLRSAQDDVKGVPTQDDGGGAPAVE